jgi:hypothetical protein
VLGGEDDPVWDGASSAHFALARFLPDGTPRTTLARGAARSRRGRAPLRLRATRAGAPALLTRASIRVRVSARMLAAHRPTVAAATTFTLPATT